MRIVTSFTSVLALICLASSSSKSFGQEVFTDDVLVRSTNPDFILDDTDGHEWVIESGEPGPTDFSIASHGGSIPRLVINTEGEVGVRATTPRRALHIVGAPFSPPTIRLESLGGFDTWDIEAGFTFGIHDSTNNETPFLIRSGAIRDSLLISSGGRVGIGIFKPDATLHVSDNANGLDTKVIIENEDGPVQQRSMLELINNGAPLLFFEDTASETSWQLNPNSNGNFFINSVGLGGGAEMVINGNNGNTIISGQMRADDFIVTSSRDSKEDFQEVDQQEVLRKVLELPIQHWRFKDDDTCRLHMGPIAEDFEQAFELGSNGKRISMIDVGGVALAAIQGLKATHEKELESHEEKLDQKSIQIADLQEELAELKDDMARIKALVLNSSEQR